MAVHRNNDIISIISSFNINSSDIEKQENSYKVMTDDYEFIIRRSKAKGEKIKFKIKLNEDMCKIGIKNIPIYISNKVGNKCIYNNKKLYCVESRVRGDKVKLRSIDECKKGVQVLAKFHKEVKNLPINSYKLKSITTKWDEKLIRKKASLNEFKNIISRRILKTALDQKYYELIDFNIELIELSIKLLEEWGYNSLVKSKGQTIVIDRFYSNVLTKKEETLYFTNLDYVKIGFDFYDLGKFIRRIMFKKEFMWDFNKAKELIDAYEEINELSRDEKMIMLSIIIYPDKFYKIGKSYYKKCVLDLTDNGMESLNKIKNNMGGIGTFIEDYFKYYSVN